MIRGFRFVAVTVAALAMGVSSAHASLTITLSQVGFADLTIVDGDGNDSSGASGAIVYSGAYGNWTLSINTAISNAPGGTYSAIDVSNTLFRDGAAGDKTLTVTVSDDGFTSPIGPGGNLQVTVRGGNTSSGGNSSVTYQGYADAFTGGVQGPFAPGTSSSTNFLANVGSPYTLTHVTVITSGSNEQSSTSGSIQGAVPEPSSLAIWGCIAVVGGGLAARRRRAQA